MLIEFHAIRDPKYWLQMIAEQLSTPVINDEVHLPAMYGQGIFKTILPPANGLPYRTQKSKFMNLCIFIVWEGKIPTLFLLYFTSINLISL